jgi:hypothetical protein
MSCPLSSAQAAALTSSLCPGTRMTTCRDGKNAAVCNSRKGVREPRNQTVRSEQHGQPVAMYSKEIPKLVRMRKTLNPFGAATRTLCSVMS